MRRRGSSRAEAADDDDVVNHFIAAGFWSRNWLLTRALATSHESARCWYYRHYMIRGLEHYHIPYTLRLRLSCKVLVLDSNHEDVLILILNDFKFICFGQCFGRTEPALVAQVSLKVELGSTHRRSSPDLK